MMPKWLRLLSGVQIELFPGRLFEDKGRQSRDEKWQWNIFLSELLSQRLKQSILEAQSK